MNVPHSLADTGATGERNRLPIGMVYTTLAICALPLALHLFGLDLGSPQANPSALSVGPLVHTLLEWTAVCLAAFIVVLSLLHYSSERDVVTPVIALALLASGIVDAFHTLAAAQIISASAPAENFIPFTWALSRLFNSSVMLLIPAILVFAHRDLSNRGPRFVYSVAFALGSFALLAIWICSVSRVLPRTQFAGAMITRPYDLVPLALYLTAALAVYPRLLHRRPGVFSHSVLLSAAPDVATQLYMAFGSSALFDNFFHVSHFTKVVSYAVPLVGLAVEYVSVHQAKKQSIQELTRTTEALRSEIGQRQRAEETVASLNQTLQQRVADVERSNQELDGFAYIASHDLKEPLRGIHNYSEFLLEDYAERLDKAGRDKLATLTRLTTRMETLIDSLLYFSRVGRTELAMGPVCLENVIAEVTDLLEASLEEADAEIRIPEKLPTVVCDRVRIGEVFLNLITNALKYNDKPNRWIEIGCRRGGTDPGESKPENDLVFSVRDNGIGIREKHLDAVFRIFKRLHGRDQYGGGTGFGLTIAKKIVERHGGRIWVESCFGEGTTFYFTLRGAEDEGKPQDESCR